MVLSAFMVMGQLVPGIDNAAHLGGLLAGALFALVLARRIGDVKATRAVGLANGANPIAIVIPCHRVIGASGALTGFGGGLPTKRALLDLEQGQRTLL